MHRCFHVQEIVDLICQQGFYDPDREGRIGILALAQTCRLLYEPAANIIWYCVPSLRPLVGKISANFWESIENGDALTLSSLRREECARLSKLAKRVRSFGPHANAFKKMQTSPGPISDNLPARHYAALSIIYGSAPLLPNVREINVVGPDHDMLVHANLFINPQITTLRILHWDALLCPTHFVGFLNSLGRRCTQLERFELCVRSPGREPGNPTAIAIMNAVHSCKWDSLTELTIDAGSPPEIIADIVSRPSLRKITICTSLGELQLPSTTLNHSLPNLEDITISTPHLPIIIEFLHALSPRPNHIHTACFWSNFPQHSSSEHWSELIRSICSQLNPATLNTLSLDDGLTLPRDSEIMEDLTEAHPYVVSPVESGLLDFRCLKVVTIITFGILAVDDQVLARMATAWPQVQELYLLGQHPLNLPPKVTLAGLTVLAENCPNLQELSIEFVAETSLTSKPGPRPSHGLRLRELNVLRSPISRPGPVAAMLADLFPCIAMFSCTGQEFASKWQQVPDFHFVSVSTRYDEVTRVYGGPVRALGRSPLFRWGELGH